MYHHGGSAGVLGRSYADRRKCRDDAAGGRPDLPVASFFVSAYSAGTCSMQIHCSQLYRQFFGLGWAATPAGLQAMEDLDELEKERTLLQAVHQPYRKKFDFTSDRIRHTHVKREKVASTEMCTFLVLNISSLQLIPVTVIAYRSKYGSPDPTGIVGAAIVATAFSTLAGIIFAKIMSAADRKRGY